MTYDTSPASPQLIELSGRESLTVSGVEDVDRFDETEIVMNTSLGVLVVTGDSLHIGKLSLDGGELHVDGRIDAIAFEDAPSSRGGLLSRLFGQFHRDGRPAQQHRFQCDRLVGIKQTPELGWHERGVGAAAQRLLQRLFLAHG